MAGQRKKEKGFTMIELMIVLVIMGILAALAIPRFMRATTRSKQSEAKQILKQIYVMQRAYRQENDTYCCNGSSMTEGGQIITLGVEAMSGARYTYTITASQNAFSAQATANLDDDPVIDTWTVDESGVVDCSINDANSATL
jgi:prepilin-type N-terminal cleavage/methylation domain-containing protein